MKPSKFAWRAHAFLVVLLSCLSGEARAQTIARISTVSVSGVNFTAFRSVDGDLISSSHPYAVSLRRRSDLGYFCSGVLIGKRHVLTAAHCVDDSRTSADSKPEVVAGTASSSMTSGEGVQVLPTTKAVIHPDYPARRFPDLAILELASDADKTLVRLPAEFLPKNGDSLLLIGWGRQSSNSQNADLVQLASMSYISRKKCAAKVNGIVHLHQICMGGDGVNSCEGDNGAPIVMEGETRSDDVLVGITGSHHVCGKTSLPDIHTNIWPYIDWIKSTAGI